LGSEDIVKRSRTNESWVVKITGLPSRHGLKNSFCIRFPDLTGWSKI
jgi:hypothetical protein